MTGQMMKSNDLVLARLQQSTERQDGRSERSWSECPIFRMAIFARTSNFGFTALSANRKPVAFTDRRGYFSHDRVGHSSDVAYRCNAAIAGVVWWLVWFGLRTLFLLAIAYRTGNPLGFIWPALNLLFLLFYVIAVRATFAYYRHFTTTATVVTR